MANTGLNYIIKVQMDQLGELQKLHDTIVAIQQLSQKGAEFNVRVNEQSLNSLTNDIATSVSKGFSRAGLGTSRGTTVSVDTTKLESSIQKLSEVVGAMGRQVPPNVTPVAATGGGAASASATVQKINTRVREIEATIKLLDDVVAQRVEATKEVIDRLKRGARAAGTAGDESAIRESLEARKARLEGIRARVASGSQGTVGITLDASVLNRAFETGAQRLSDALRKGIEEATAGLATAITEAVSRGLGGTGAPPVPPTSPQQAMAVVRNFAGSPDIDAAIAAKAQRYMQGLDTRSANLTAAAAQSGVMAIPRQYEQIMTRRVTDTGQAAMFKRQIDELKAERAKFQAENNTNAAASAQAKIDDLEIKRSQAVFATINKQIDSAVTQYRAVLATQRERNQLSPEEYTRKLTAINEQANARTTLMSGTDIGREMVLLPQALAQYVRNTLNQYVQQINRFKETGQPIDQSLLDEIQSSAFISNLAGARPRDAKQASGAAYRVNQFLREFGSTKTAFEYIRSRGQLGLPAFNPNLDVATAPFLQGMEDPGSRPRAEREQYLQAFFARGGGFAPQTEERRAYAQKMLERLYAEQATGNMRESRERLLLEYQREMEFGGRYYYTGSGQVAGQGRRGLIDGGALLSPDERVRVRAGGGVRSNLVGTPLGGLEQELSADAKAATNLYQAMTYVEGALNRVNKTIGELAKVSFDPMIAEFKRLGDVMKPYAETLAKTQAALAASRNLSGQVSRVAEAREKARAVEEERTSGAAARAALRPQRESERTLAALAGMSNIPRTVRPFSADPAELRDIVLRQFGQISSAQYRMYDQNALIGAQIAAGMNPTSSMRSATRTSAQYDALMASYATNLRAFTRQDPVFFGESTGEVRSAAAGVIRTGAQRRVVAENLQALQQAEALTKSIDERLAKLSGSDSDPKVAEVIKGLNAERDKAQQVMGQRFDFLRSRGLLGANDEKSVRAVADIYGRLNRELGRTYDALLKVANGAVEAEKKGGSFANQLINKFRNLSQYVLAGGVIYEVAAQLRQAASQAVALEADLRRIQGVLPSRSERQAGLIGQGILQGAMDYGTDVRTSVQAGKLFAQTGASPQQTIEMTRAALAGTVGAGLETGQATELLIAVENITQRQVGSMDILDRISRIESQYAVTAQDLSNAIQRAGSLAQQLQPQALGAVDALDLIIGASTAIIERTRITGEQAATSLRFIISRLAAPEVSQQLQERFGIQLAGDDPNQLRPLQDILQDIATRYQQLQASGNTVQAQQLLTTFAGARQSNVAAALLSDFDKVMKVASESAMAYGDTQARVNLQLDTMQARLNQFNTAFVGFAESVLSDTGIAGLFKILLQGGTGVMRAGQSGFGALATGAGLYAAQYPLRMSQSFMTSRAAAMSATAVAEGVAPATAFAARGGAAAAGAGAAAAGGLATGASVFGGILLAVGALEVVAKGITSVVEYFDIRRQDEFNQRQFRESELYRSMQDRAQEFGLTSGESLSEIVRAALNTASTTVASERQKGLLAENQTYNRTTELLRKQLEQDLPNFSSLGDEATRTAEALALLRQAARYSMAAPSEMATSFVKDLNNLFADVDEDVGEVGRRLRRSFRQSETRTATGELITAAGFDMGAFERTFNFLDFSRFRAPGDSRSFRQIANEAAPGQELAALDRYAQQNLFVGASQRARLEAIEADFRRRNPNQAVTPASIAQAIMAMPNIDGAGRDQLNQAYLRLNNQRDLASQLVTQINAAVGNADGSRFGALNRNGPRQGAQAGDMFADAFMQALELARKQLEESATAGFITAAGLKEMNAQIDRMGRSSTRTAQAANLAVTAISVRDRMMEPIVAYGMAQAEIGTRERMAQRFGTSFDAVGARAQAAEQLLIGLDQVPVRILGDMARTAGRVVAGGTGGTLMQAIQAAEDGASTDRRQRGAQVTGGDLLAGFMTGQRDSIRQLNAMAEQYTVATQRGLAGFIQQGLGSSNSELRTAAGVLQQTLDRLGELGAVNTPDKLRQLAQIEGDLNAQRERALQIVREEIDAARDREVLLQNIARYAESRRVDIGIDGMRQQAALQGRLMMVQQDPRRALEAFNLQQQLIESAFQVRVQQANEQLVNERSRIAADTRLGTNERDAQILNAEQAQRNEARQAELDRMNQQYQAALQITTSATRRRQEEAMQLVNDLTSPLRELLMSPRNFNRAGYQRFGQQVGEASQRFIVDQFMKQVFSESGLLGAKLRDAFADGAWNTQTAIERAFIRGASQVEASIRAALGNAPGLGRTLPRTEDLPVSLRGTRDANGNVVVPGGWQNGDVVETATGNVVGGPRYDAAMAGATGAAAGAASKVPFGQRMQGVFEAAGPMIGSLAGSMINTGIDSSFAGEGASMGALVGNMFLPGFGGLVGGLLGGLFGSRIGKDQEKPEQQLSALERIERNTRQQIEAIENQTRLLTLDSRFLNVPAGFTVPGFRPFAGGAGSATASEVTINVYGAQGQNEEVIATKVAAALQTQLRGFGTSFDLRN